MNRNPLSHVMHLATVGDSAREDGRCHICLRTAKLSREHIPPRAAFNDCDRLWERLFLPERAGPSARQVRLRGGFRVATLCAKCNNGLCSPYAKAYVRFVRHLVESPRLFDSSGTARLVSVPCDTLLVAKQIATMILASEPVTFAAHNAGLREFVLHRHSTYQSPFRVYAFLVPDAPGTGTVTRFHTRVDTFAPGYTFTGGELSWYPFGIVYATEIGRGYDLDGLTDVTRWFTTGDEFERRRNAISLHCRLTGVDSIQCCLGHRRVRPQIDYVGGAK